MEKGQITANLAQLLEDNAYFIVPAKQHDVCGDDRLLIPFVQDHKIGFVNQDVEPVVAPKYDIICGDVFKESDYVHVGIRFSVGYQRSNGKVQTYDRIKWGLIDFKGKVIIDCNYAGISVSDDGKLFTLKDHNKGFCVIDHSGNKIVPYGKYGFIDGYTMGYARVRNDNKWGIINRDGNITIPVEYNEIWNFYPYKKSNFTSTRVLKKDGEISEFDFMYGKLYTDPKDNVCQYHQDDAYGCRYGEYAGTYAQDIAGYSDDVINDAFDGNPDAYWNID